MNEMNNKYINPLTNFGFKKIFGDEANKDLIMDFLNALLNDRNIYVRDLIFNHNDDINTPEIGNDDIIELICTNSDNQKIYVELLKPVQNFFADRAIFHALQTLDKQSNSPEWHYKAVPLISISILDFVSDSSPEVSADYLHFTQLADAKTKTVFFEKLTCVFIEVPKFLKSSNELTTRLDKWLYLIKNLRLLSHSPDKFLDDDIFRRLFEAAEVKKLEFHEAFEYKDSLAHHHNWYDDSETPRELRLEQELVQGIALCQEQGVTVNNHAIAKTAFKMGLAIDAIARITGLSVEDLEVMKITVNQ